MSCTFGVVAGVAGVEAPPGMGSFFSLKMDLSFLMLCVGTIPPESLVRLQYRMNTFNPSGSKIL